MVMTFDEMCEHYDKYGEMEFSVDRWYPTIADLEKYVLPNPDRYIDFLIWLESNPPLCMTKEEKEAMKMISNILKDNIEIAEDNMGE